MAFALLALGFLLFMAAYQNNVALLGKQLASDMLGGKGFLVWIVALFIVGALGYSDNFKSLSRTFLALILVVVFLSNKGFFSKLTGLVYASGAKSATADLGAIIKGKFASPTANAIVNQNQDTANQIQKVTTA